MGRQPQRAELARKLKAAPLLTLVGVGGIGKTRLALRAARDAREHYAHGAWLVELTRTEDPAGVAFEVARALGVRERPGWSALETLCSALRTRQVLLLLDNCEHVVGACAELATALLRHCSDVSILATSREPLGATGETVYQVPPMVVSDAAHPADSRPEGEAIDLLFDRMGAHEPSFQLGPADREHAGRICARLDGLPLAIELAAARTPTMSLAEVADRLDDPFSLLTGGLRSAPARQQTLRATIDWSYRLLNEREQVLLRRLAVFRGGFPRSAVVAVCAGADVPASDVDDVLDRLVAQSLVVVVKQLHETRFSLLETVRQYCHARLADAGEVAMLRERHRDWCLGLVAGVVVDALNADDVVRLEPELENLRSALSWAIGTHQVAAAARVALGLATSWFFHGSFGEGRLWLTAVLDLAPIGSAWAELSLVSSWAGVLAQNQGDYAGGSDLFGRALELARASGDNHALTVAESRLGRLIYLQGDPVRARDILEHALANLTTANAPIGAIIRDNLAYAYLELGETAHASTLFAAVADAANASQSRFFLGRILSERAHLAERQGDLAQADAVFSEAVDAQRAIGDQPGLIESLTMRGAVAVLRDERQLAATLLLEALDIAVLSGTRMRLARLFEALASLFVDWDPEACVRLAAAAEQLRLVLGAVPLPSERERLGRYLQSARQRLGARVYATSWSAAATVGLDATLSEAHTLLQAFEQGRSPEVASLDIALGAGAGVGGLSPREREVAILVTRGLSNREIADDLVITGKTVEAHVNHILNKLGLSNRVQIATWGMRHGLVGAGLGDAEAPV